MYRQGEDMVTAFAVFLTLAYAPAVTWILAERFNWLLYPYCCNLASKLKSVEAVLDLCEISAEDFDLLSSEVSDSKRIQIVGKLSNMLYIDDQYSGLFS